MNKSKKTFFINIIGCLMIIGIAFYVTFFKKDEMESDKYTISVIILFSLGVILLFYNIILYNFIRKNMK